MLLKKRAVFIALYARGNGNRPNTEAKFHWALLIGPENEGGTKGSMQYHAKERIVNGQSQWEFEAVEISIRPTGMLLTRIMVGKVKKEDRLDQILRGIPVRPEVEGWNCIGWIKEALETVWKDGNILSSSCISDWDAVKDAATTYCQKKIDEHRFNGHGNFDMTVIPTFNFIKGNEIIG